MLALLVAMVVVVMGLGDVDMLVSVRQCGFQGLVSGIARSFTNVFGVCCVPFIDTILLAVLQIPLR